MDALELTEVAPNEDRPAAPEWQPARLIEGYLTTQLLYVAAKLGVPDLLADGPRSGHELAAAAGVHEASLVRVLRGLVLQGVLADEDDGRFALTELGTLVRSDVPRSPRATAIGRAEMYDEPAAALLRALRAGLRSRSSSARRSSTISHGIRSTRRSSRARWPAAPSARPTTSPAGLSVIEARAAHD